MQNHCRNTDFRCFSKLVFVFLQCRIIRRVSVPDPVAVQRRCDPIGVVKRLRGGGELRLSKLPLWRPRLPAFAGQCFRVSFKFDLPPAACSGTGDTSLSGSVRCCRAPSHSFQGSGWCIRSRTPKRGRAPAPPCPFRYQFNGSRLNVQGVVCRNSTSRNELPGFREYTVVIAR
jgi:hypothetical protein